MNIFVAVISILIVTGLAWAFKKATKWAVCPPCAGVSATWLLILIGMWTGWLPYQEWLLIAAILMGGSVVGIAFQVEKRLPARHSPILWKTVFLSVGFTTVYFALTRQWPFAAVGLVLSVLVAFAFIFVSFGSSPGKHTKALEEKMKSCC